MPIANYTATARRRGADTTRDTDWREHAACAGDHDLYEQADRDLGSPNAARHTSDTVTDCLAICAECPVRDACLQQALTEEAIRAQERYSIRGGTTPKERTAMHRKETRTNQPCGTVGAHDRHRRNGETPCDPCREAFNSYKRRRYESTGQR